MPARCLALLVLLALPSLARADPSARANRLGISFGVGFGSAALSSFHQGVDELASEIERLNPPVKLVERPKSNLQINAELAFRYYFPYYLLAQVGYGAVYNWASTAFEPGGGSVSSWQLAMEVPILVGGYYPFLGRLYVFGAVGPSPFFYARSFWDANPGGISDFKASGGVGVHALGGAEFLVGRSFAVGLELRYRYLKARELRELNSGARITTGDYDLDLSGISLGLTLRMFAI